MNVVETRKLNLSAIHSLLQTSKILMTKQADSNIPQNLLRHSGTTYEGLKSKIYKLQLKEHIHRIINNCDICSGGKYDRNPIKNKFHLTETP